MTEAKHTKLWLYFSLIVFATLIAAFFIILALWMVLFHFQVVSVSPFGHKMPIVWFLGGSFLIGTMLALFVGRRIIKPIQNISRAFAAVSQGNFEVRADENAKIAEIHEMACGFNAMVYDLSHIETLRTDFVVNVSHEFKTPIASIEGYATLLQGTDLSPEKKNRYVEKIIENAGRLSALITNVLALSKLENQKTVLNQRSYRLDEQIRCVILLLEDRWREKSLDFDLELPDCVCFANEQLLDRVWYNLIDNAIKYSKPGGRISVALSEQENSLLVTVADQGCGMDTDTQKHIFEKFYQGDSSRKTEGNGLGLALVQSIVELCSGSIHVYSRPDQGATFSVRLPK